MKWIIFFCCYFGKAQQQDSYIIITEDSIKAFNYKWEILQTKDNYLEGDGDSIYKAHLKFRTIVNKDTINAELKVKGKNCILIIPNIEIATFTQLPHKEEYYPLPDYSF